MKRLIFALIILAVLSAGVWYWYPATIYGGKTPAETMQLLMAALEDGDAELASRYFMPDDSGSIEKWQKNWRQAKAEGRFPEIISVLERAQPNPSNTSYSGDFKYIVKDEDGMIATTIDFNFFEKEGVWKIESL